MQRTQRLDPGRAELGRRRPPEHLRDVKPTHLLEGYAHAFTRFVLHLLFIDEKRDLQRSRHEVLAAGAGNNLCPSSARRVSIAADFP